MDSSPGKTFLKFDESKFCPRAHSKNSIHICADKKNYLTKT